MTSDATNGVREVDPDLDAKTFHAEIVAQHQPVVMRQFASEWPLVVAAKQGRLINALRSADGGTRIGMFMADASLGGRYFYDDSLRGFNFERGEVALGQLLDELERLEDVVDPPGLYAGAIPLQGALAPLAAQHPMPLLDDATERLTSLWLGNAGRTATHWDLPHNIAVVVGGIRRFTLFPPDQYESLYVGPIDRTLAGQPVSLVDPDAPDLDRFPRYAKAQAVAQTVTLLPGDALFVPTLWFHHVAAESPIGALVNFWWREAADHMMTPLTTLLHGLLTVRDLPEQERRLWRQMFDYYLFDANESTHEHIPSAARGFLGEMTEEQSQRLRAFLIASLGGAPRG
ncbi:MAG: cupin-like domain-containing protein [Pseudomonadota bacterium]